MDQYVALDVSLKEVSVCVLGADGTLIYEGRTASDPASLVGLIRAKAPRAVRIGLETGSTSAWLAHALRPKVCRSSAWMPGTRMLPSRAGQPRPTGAMPGAWPRCCAWAGTAK